MNTFAVYLNVWQIDTSNLQISQISADRRNFVVFTDLLN